MKATGRFLSEPDPLGYDLASLCQLSMYQLFVWWRVAIVSVWTIGLSIVTKSFPDLATPWTEGVHEQPLLGSSVHGILQARILEWVAISFSRGSSWPRNLGLNPVSYIAGRFFTDWAMREALDHWIDGPMDMFLFCHHCIGPGVIKKKKKRMNKQL